MIIYVLIWALILRIALLVLRRNEPIISDSQDYHLLALNLLKGRYFVPDTALDQFRTPGYPVFLALMYRIFGKRSIFIIQIVLNLGSIFLTYMIGYVVFNQNAGLLAAMILIFEPDFVYYVYDLLSDTLYTFLLLLSIYLMLLFDQTGSNLYIFFTALILSAMTYIKPGSFLLPVIYCVLLPFGLMISMICIYFAFIIPWMTRNYIKYGHFRMSSIGAYNLFAYNASRPYNMHAQIIKQDRVNCGFEIYGYLKKGAISMILRNPAILITNIAKGLYRQFFSGTWHLFINRFMNGSSPERALTYSKCNIKHITKIPAVIQFFYLISFYVLFIIGSIELIHIRAGLMILMIVLYFSLIPLGAGHPRYKVPIIPLMILCAINAIN